MKVELSDQPRKTLHSVLVFIILLFLGGLVRANSSRVLRLVEFKLSVQFFLL